MQFNSPSRFLHDIDRKYMETQRSNTPNTYRTEERPRWSNNTWGEPKPISTPMWRGEVSTPVSAPATAKPVSGATSGIASAVWKEGDRVSHRVFGEGTVARVYRDEVTENDKIEIRFDKQGTKTLLLTHAKLDRV